MFPDREGVLEIDILEEQERVFEADEATSEMPATATPSTSTNENISAKWVSSSSYKNIAAAIGS